MLFIKMFESSCMDQRVVTVMFIMFKNELDAAKITLCGLN